MRPSAVNPLVSSPPDAPVTRQRALFPCPLLPTPRSALDQLSCARDRAACVLPPPSPVPSLSSSECFVKHLHTAVECQGSSAPEREHLWEPILPGNVPSAWNSLPPALASPSAELKPAPLNTPATHPPGQGSQAPADFTSALPILCTYRCFCYSVMWDCF